MVVGWVGWLGPAFIKPLVWVFVLGVLFPWGGCSPDRWWFGLVSARILRTV
jgi:hypothetical protein